MCVAVRCSELQCVAVCCSVAIINLSCQAEQTPLIQMHLLRVLQSFTECCSVLQCVAVLQSSMFLQQAQ